MNESTTSKTAQEIFELLKANFAEGVLSQSDKPIFEYTIDIHSSILRDVSLFLRDNDALQFNNLMLLSACDDGNTLSIFYHLDSIPLKHKIVLKASLPRENPEIATVSDIWAHANWEEREAYDMMGIIFLHHPDLRRILMPYDWEFGYPLRKDYKNPEFYQGMKVV